MVPADVWWRPGRLDLSPIVTLADHLPTPDSLEALDRTLRPTGEQQSCSDTNRNCGSGARVYSIISFSSFDHNLILGIFLRSPSTAKKISCNALIESLIISNKLLYLGRGEAYFSNLDLFRDLCDCNGANKDNKNLRFTGIHASSLMKRVNEENILEHGLLCLNQLARVLRDGKCYRTGMCSSLCGSELGEITFHLPEHHGK